MIPGFSIGHHTAAGEGWLTGTTVVLAGAGAVGGVDVRGGGPGTRETDLLSPVASMEQVHAVVLTGGSAYGLAAADGVMQALEERGIGYPVRIIGGPQRTAVVPIVPAAVVFDLGRGGDISHRPDDGFGRAAVAAAERAAATGEPIPAMGNVGGGTGAASGGLKGGFGYAETVVGPHRVAAAMVVNSVGSAADPSGRLWADTARRLPTPTAAEVAVLVEERRRHIPPLNTTIGVVLTDAVLTKPQATKLAQVGHDGLARAIRPVHSMFDGDTIFCLASGREPLGVDDLSRRMQLYELLAAAADMVAEACLAAVLSAESVGDWRAYADLVHGVR
ncbi:L-aminopeptidase/D-esterase [Raineyella antarctica]|uniref:L-aminopeptidase/D-esterase n=1 Tax=Raineyella antarctica TaxID=1577474 RepID=A0A1G6GV50_9ACTN|nr:P1 family peptidase [Raineyella antarctica]SDB85848.1 L-aminopeptidase/D-esterase [Raineyella antarctica]